MRSAICCAAASSITAPGSWPSVAYALGCHSCVMHQHCMLPNPAYNLVQRARNIRKTRGSVD